MMKAVLFDLDGTLLDTLGDLTDALNWALSELDLPGRTLDEVRRFVGNGADRLIERALPEGSQQLRDRCISLFKQRYEAKMDAKTRPYPGVIRMLDELNARDVRCAVISNKYDGAVEPLCEKYFGDRIALAVGERAGVPPKPAPDGCLYVLSRLKIEPREAIYIGDSDVDVLTAHNAGLRCVGVGWGFRDREELMRAGVDFFADDVDALLKILLA